MNGKGSRPRPKGVTNKVWEDNWNKIFKKKDKNGRKSSNRTSRSRNQDK